MAQGIVYEEKVNKLFIIIIDIITVSILMFASNSSGILMYFFDCLMIFHSVAASFNFLRSSGLNW